MSGRQPPHPNPGIAPRHLYQGNRDGCRHCRLPLRIRIPRVNHNHTHHHEYPYHLILRYNISLNHYKYHNLFVGLPYACQLRPLIAIRYVSLALYISCLQIELLSSQNPTRTKPLCEVRDFALARLSYNRSETRAHREVDKSQLFKTVEGAHKRSTHLSQTHLPRAERLLCLPLKNRLAQDHQKLQTRLSMPIRQDFLFASLLEPRNVWKKAWRKKGEPPVEIYSFLGCLQHAGRGGISGCRLPPVFDQVC